MQSRRWQIAANIVTLVFTLVMNTLANTLPLNGRNTGEISDSFDALFTPAGYVFGIWGLIYLGLVGFTIFQALPGQQRNVRVAATGWWVALSNLANGIWVIFWHYEQFVLTIVVMLVLLVSLLVIYQRVTANAPVPGDTATRWLVQAPFSLYLGWISVATIANAAVVLLVLGVNPGAAGVWWTVLMIAVAATLALWLRDPIFTLVIVWAVVGILLKRAEFAPIVAACALAVVVCIVGQALALIRQARARPAARPG